MWWDDLTPWLRGALTAAGLLMFAVAIVALASLVETRAASAPLDENNPCTLTVWRMSGSIDRIEARDWPTIEHQIGGGVRLKFTTTEGIEEIGGMIAYHIRPKGQP